MVKKGFTLIELLVAIAMMSLIVVAGTSLFLRTIKGGTKSDSLVKLKQDGTLVMSKMAGEIRNATDISDCDTIGELQFVNVTTKTFLIDNERIALEDTSTHYLTSDRITASGLSFTCSTGSPTNVEISFTLTDNFDPNIQEVFTTKISNRNY